MALVRLVSTHVLGIPSHAAQNKAERHHCLLDLDGGLVIGSPCIQQANRASQPVRPSPRALEQSPSFNRIRLRACMDSGSASHCLSITESLAESEALNFLPCV